MSIGIVGIGRAGRYVAEDDGSAVSGATSSLANQKLQCTTKSVSVDTSGFASPVGTPATVTATVTCVVNLSDVAVPGLPGTRTITATMSSPLDTYRER